MRNYVETRFSKNKTLENRDRNTSKCVGWCWDGLLAKMGKFADISYKDMFKRILEGTEKRIGII